jgi:membrane protease YdiL (CAAX protease family)
MDPSTTSDVAGGRRRSLPWYFRLPLFLAVIVAARVAGDLLTAAFAGPFVVAPLATIERLSGVWALAAVAPGVVAMDVAYRLTVRRWEARAPRELMGPAWGAELAWGMLLGSALLGAVVGLLAVLGCFRVQGVHPWLAAVPALAMSASSAYGEELAVRGVLQRLLAEGIGGPGALTVSALVFGALHSWNPAATPLSIASIVAAGLLLGAAFELTGRLWFAMGLHFAWNFMQGGVFGIPVSGHPLPGWLSSQVMCATALSGGAFGVEGSVLAVIVCAGAAAVLLWRARRFHAGERGS